jgi:hypothetical protein
VEQIFPVRPAVEKGCDLIHHGSWRHSRLRETAKHGDSLGFRLGLGNDGVT